GKAADEPGGPPSAPQERGPLVPGGRPLVGQQRVEELERALLLAEAHERAHVAQLVRRVLLPVRVAVASRLELPPVAVEGARQRGLRQVSDLARGRERDAGRRRVEVAELGRA